MSVAGVLVLLATFGFVAAVTTIVSMLVAGWERRTLRVPVSSDHRRPSKPIR